MSVYVITGGTTGIGAAVRATLLGKGEEVFNIDLKEGDCLANLSKKEDRRKAIEAVTKRYPNGSQRIFGRDRRKPKNKDGWLENRQNCSILNYGQNDVKWRNLWILR